VIEVEDKLRGGFGRAARAEPAIACTSWLDITVGRPEGIPIRPSPFAPAGPGAARLPRSRRRWLRSSPGRREGEHDVTRRAGRRLRSRGAGRPQSEDRERKERIAGSRGGGPSTTRSRSSCGRFSHFQAKRVPRMPMVAVGVSMRTFQAPTCRSGREVRHRPTEIGHQVELSLLG